MPASQHGSSCGPVMTGPCGYGECFYLSSVGAVQCAALVQVPGISNIRAARWTAPTGADLLFLSVEMPMGRAVENYIFSTGEGL